MNFVYPGFLLALLALLIPIIIHLFNFRRFKVVYFSSTRFLKEVKEETATRNKLKHLLILISRCLALAFLVFAFAQPYIPRDKNQAKVNKKAVSIYIDNSFSMDARADDQSLLEKARQKALEIANAYQEDDRFQLLTNDFEGRHQRLLSKEEFAAFLEEVELSPKVQKLSQVVQRQKEVLANSNMEGQVSYLLSDFQESITDLETDTSLSVNLIPFSGVEERNVSVDSCWFEAPVQTLKQSARLMVRISNRGETDVKDSRISLHVNDQIKAISDFSISAGETIVDTLSFSITQSGWQLAEVSITDYPISFDDTYFMTFEVAEKIPLLIIHDKEASPYLLNVYEKSPLFDLTVNSSLQIDYASFPDFALIVLDRLGSISTGLASELKQKLENGGNLLIFPSANTDITSYNDFLQNVEANLMAPKQERLREVVSINTEEAVFSDVFESVPENMSLPKASLSYPFRQNSRSREEVLMRFKDGGSFISKYPYGRGGIYFCASPLDKSSSDLTVQGDIFVPFLYKVAILGGSYHPLAYVIGQEDWIPVQAGLPAREGVLKVKGEEQEFIPEQRSLGDKILLNISEQASSSGSYEILSPETDIGEWVSLNYDRRESSLKTLKESDLKERYEGMGFEILPTLGAGLGELIGELDQGIRLWKLCIIFTLIFLIIEILLIRFWP